MFYDVYDVLRAILPEAGRCTGWLLRTPTPGGCPLGPVALSVASVLWPYFSPTLLLEVFVPQTLLIILVNVEANSIPASSFFHKTSLRQWRGDAETEIAPWPSKAFGDRLCILGT